MAQIPTVQSYLESKLATPAPTINTTVGTVDLIDREKRLVGHVSVDTVKSLPLPAGASTAANQTLANSNLGDDTDPPVPAVRVQGGSQGVPLPIIGSRRFGSTYSPLVFKDLGVHVTFNVKTGSCNVFSLVCNYVTGASIVFRYLQLFNTATTPAVGAVPAIVFTVPSGGGIIVGTDFFTNEGLNFSSGVAFAWSSTAGTYTAATASEQFTIITYI